MERIALDGVQQGLGQVVEIEERWLAHMVHGDLDGVITPAGARAAPFLAEELVEQRLVVFGLGGEAVTGQQQRRLYPVKLSWPLLLP